MPDEFWFQHLNFGKKEFPFSIRLELTHQCNFSCFYCFIKNAEKKVKELTFKEWRWILDKIYAKGGLYLTFTGGEPFTREDFLRIYSCAKKKGFLITLFTNGSLLDEKTLDFLARYPPYLIEITLNAITESTFDKITRTKGNFNKVLKAIEGCVKRKLPLIIKSNLMKENKDEIPKIKHFADMILPHAKHTHCFRYDLLLLPGLDGNPAPLRHRLAPDELIEVIKKDKDMRREYIQDCKRLAKVKARPSPFLYRCESYRCSFTIDPWGRLKFCPLSDKFSVDLFEVGAKEDFSKLIPDISKIKFKTDSPCIRCSLRVFCHTCPSRAFLEEGWEESPVEYYCALAKKAAQECKS